MEKIKSYIEKEKQISDMEYELITEFIRLSKDANLSQQDIANQSEVIWTTITRIERGMNSPQVKTMLQILETLGYTLKIEKLEKKHWNIVSTMIQCFCKEWI